MNEPRRHHYIPQFILRNFCHENSEYFFYYSVEDKAITQKEPKDIFMARDLYRDEINNPEDRMKIERDFSKFEREVAEIIKDRFLCESEIVVSQYEEEMIRVFFALMGFRSFNASQSFGENAPQANKEFYSFYQKNKGLPDFWKRNLGQLVSCRSFSEIMDNPIIDEPIKVFMRRDIHGLVGRYFSMVECPDSCEFVIGDTYPVVITGYLPNGFPLEMYSIFPLSSKRAIISVCEEVTSVPREARVLRECVLLKPISMENQLLKIRVKKLFEEEVGYINKAIISNAKTGVAFRNENSQKILMGNCAKQKD